MPTSIQLSDLENIQANILKPHGRDHVWGLFIQFGEDIGLSCEWIRDFASSDQFGVTSASRQNIDSRSRRINNSHDGGIVTNLLFSAEGLRHLGIERLALANNEAFNRGMKSGDTALLLDDRPFGYWETRYHDRLDALILLGDDMEGRLAERTASIERTLEARGVGTVLFVEKGKMLRSGGVAREHFGFADGISQPEFWRSDGTLATQDLGLVLEKEDEGRYGSYLVFRKLEQDVPRFYERVYALRTALGLPAEQVEAQIIGRFKDGTPATLHNEPVNQPSNDFNYDHDEDGARCPFHAHIRKANPRETDSFQHQFVRRGLPYDEPGNGVGLLFMAYQSNISNQYEFVQRNWINNPRHNDAGLDPIVGEARSSSAPGRRGRPGEFGQEWNLAWDNPASGRRYISLSELVTFRGGEYFYAPSIPALTQMEPIALRTPKPPKYERKASHVFQKGGGRFGRSY